jgi:hypothetical protein
MRAFTGVYPVFEEEPTPLVTGHLTIGVLVAAVAAWDLVAGFLPQSIL